MKTKHTPGPWNCSDNYNGVIPIDAPTTSTGYESSVEICRVTCDDEESMVANAKLISSAPDLLEALEAILPEFEMLYEQFDPDGQLGAWIEWSVMAQKAIHKAKGEQQ